MNITKNLVKELERDQSKSRQGSRASIQTTWLALEKQDRLAETYRLFDRAMGAKYPEVVTQTLAERRLHELLQRQTRLKIFRSVWIGTRNVDLFIPSIGLCKDGFHRGLAIELEGGIHHHEIKMRKDASKEKYLHDLGIVTHCIFNDDISEVTVRNLIANIRDYPRLCSRTRLKVWRQIYIETIAKNAKEFPGIEPDAGWRLHG